MFEFDPLALLAVVLVNAMFAYSQSVALKAGVFSVATVGLAAVAAYMAGFLVTKAGWSPWPAGAVAIATSVVFAAALALPISRLRGTYAAIATLAFVIIIQTAAENFIGFTGGANGLSGIPRYIDWPGLAIVAVICIILLTLVYRSQLGIRFNVVRQDEQVAAAQGVSAAATHFIAFLISGALAGIGGVCFAYYSYALFPDSFSFTAVTDVLAYVFLGGFRSWRGPLLGAIVVTALPQVFLPLANWTLIVDGAILILVVSLLPEGVLDTVEMRLRARRSDRRTQSALRDHTPPRASVGGGPTVTAGRAS